MNSSLTISFRKKNCARKLEKSQSLGSFMPSYLIYRVNTKLLFIQCYYHQCSFLSLFCSSQKLWWSQIKATESKSQYAIIWATYLIITGLKFKADKFLPFFAIKVAFNFQDNLRCSYCEVKGSFYARNTLFRNFWGKQNLTKIKNQNIALLSFIPCYYNILQPQGYQRL